MPGLAGFSPKLFHAVYTTRKTIAPRVKGNVILSPNVLRTNNWLPLRPPNVGSIMTSSHQAPSNVILSVVEGSNADRMAPAVRVRFFDYAQNDMKGDSWNFVIGSEVEE